MLGAKVFFVLYETLKFHKFQSGNFKYDNSFFQIPVQKYANREIMVPNLFFSLTKFYVKEKKKFGTKISLFAYFWTGI